MNGKQLAYNVNVTFVAHMCLIFLFKCVSSTLNEEIVTFVSGGQVLKYPQLAVLNPTMHEVDFD